MVAVTEPDSQPRLLLIFKLYTPGANGPDVAEGTQVAPSSKLYSAAVVVMVMLPIPVVQPAAFAVYSGFARVSGTAVSCMCFTNEIQPWLFFMAKA